MWRPSAFFKRSQEMERINVSRFHRRGSIAPSAAFGSKRPISKACAPIAQICFSTASRVSVAAISFDLTRALRERNNVPWS